MSDTRLPINIDELIKGRTVEGERLEFKKGWNPETVIHTLCAFANDFHNLGGGYIIIGIDEKDGQPILPPAGIPANRIDKIQKDILALGYRLQPAYHPVIAPDVIQDRHVLILWAPGGIVARYLLGRSYRKQNCPDKALDILEPVIKNHPDEFRSFVEYALCLVSLKKPYKNAIAILELSTLYGYSDPRFIATLGGMLFMDNNFSKAESVFAESLKRDFTSSEMNTIQFRPPDPIDPNNFFRVTGKVISVKTGHAILESPGYPNFLCPGSKYKGVIMQPGLMVTFEVAFSAKGPVADRPMICNV
jgi:hypothetical protein